MENGYCHYNDDNDNKYFEINLFNINIRLKQDPGTRALGHGAVVWDSSVIFSKYMENNPKIFSHSELTGKKVLELGSGCGLAGLSFMIKGAEVVLTDLLPVTTVMTTPNAESVFSQVKSQGNGLTPIRPRVIPLDWSDREASQLIYSTIEPPSLIFDIIIMTDCVFSKALTSSIIETLREHSNSRTDIYCCYEIRDEEINDYFIEEMSQVFNLKRIKSNSLNPNYSNQLIQIVRAKLKRNLK